MQLVALIMAGGEGKRFWPLSNKNRPKQFLTLIGGKSMIRNTFERIISIIPIQSVYVVTVESYINETIRHLPELPRENIIVEPEGKNTAPCIALGSLVIEKRMPDSTVVVLPADHAIGNDKRFREAILCGSDVANTKLPSGDFPLVTFGVTPTRPETGYGYVKSSAKLVYKSRGFSAWMVSRFTEKPDLRTAKSFVKRGDYLWNSGIFIWRSSAIIGEFFNILPDWYEYFDNILQKIDTRGETEAIRDFYRKLKPGSIDKLILERSRNTVLIPIDIHWSDIGNWQSLDEFLRKKDQENISIGDYISLDSSSNLLYSDKKKIAIVGVKNLVVVDTDDAILVLDKTSAQKVKDLVDSLPKKGSDGLI
ncbi:MAG: mannose-1-phosphate guanylyltransferase [Thermodesulfobacteriota bacterium]